MYAYQKINPATAVEKWSNRLSEATMVKDSGRLKTMSLLAEVKSQLDGPINFSEKKLMEAYGISTTGNILGMGPVAWGSDPGTGVGATQGAWSNPAYKPGSGDLPSMVMSMAMNVAAYCVGFDIVNTIAVDMPSAFFQFLDSVYAGGSIEGDAGENPIYVKFAANQIKGDFNYSQFAYNDNIFITKAAAADGDAIYGKYIGTSFVDGQIILKIESTGTVATKVYTSNNAKNIAAVLTGINPTAAIVKGSTATAVDGTATALNDVKADLVSAIREHVRGFSNSDGITKTPMSREKTEKGTKNKLNLRLWSKTTEMKGREILADITKVQLRDLRAYGVDGMAQLYSASQNQLIQDINDDIIDRVFALGVKNHAQLWAGQKMNLNLFIAPAGTANKAFTDFGVEFKDTLGVDRKAEFGNIINSETNSAAENSGTRQRRLYSRILAAAAMVGTVGRYGKGDFAVVGPQISAALQDCAGFVAYPMENTLGSTAALHLIGKIGNVSVYENPKFSWNDNRICVGFRGNENAPGVKLLAYDLASTVEIIAESTMAPKISVLSRYELVDAGFYPETQYITFAAYTDFAGNQWI